MPIQAPITILGAGSWGTALAISIANNKQEVRLWGHKPEHMQKIACERVNTTYLPGISFPEKLSITEDLTTALEGVNDILIAVPSHAFRQVLISIAPFITSKSRLVLATKGLDPKTTNLLDAVVKETLKRELPIAILAGPSFAKEVALEMPTAITIACQDADFTTDLVERLHKPTFRIYTSTDITGTEIAGAIKNVLAIAIGISDGLGYGANARSALITRGLSEMVRLGVAVGGQQETFYGLAGLGDLILTSTDNQSRNRRFGLALGQGLSIEEAKQQVGQVIEGAHNATQVYHLAQRYNITMPITTEVYRILHEHLKPLDAVNELLAREPTSETQHD